MVETLIEPKLYEKQPSVCPKENCGGTIFLPHEDGWQCFNCMKIVYKADKKRAKPVSFKRYQRESN